MNIIKESEKSAIEVYKVVLSGRRFPKGYWQKPEARKNAIEITKYLSEEVLELSVNDVKKKLTYQVFRDNGLGGMLSRIYNNSSYEAIDTAYPEQIQAK